MTNIVGVAGCSGLLSFLMTFASWVKFDERKTHFTQKLPIGSRSMNRNRSTGAVDATQQQRLSIKKDRETAGNEPTRCSDVTGMITSERSRVG